jgi:2-dehydro-3-deoxygluconokinase
MAHEVLAFGEALLRLQPNGDHRLEDAPLFHAYVGGAELNTAYALGGLGHDVAWFSVVPEGALGRRVLHHLRGANVDVSLVKTAPGRVGTYWVEYGREPRSIEVLYDRKDSTVTRVRAEDAPWEAVESTRVFFVSGITPALSLATRELTLQMAARARAAGATVVTDLNYRARLWSAAEAGPVLEQLAKSAHVVIVTEDDLAALYAMRGECDDVGRKALARFGCRTVVLTRGGQGAISVTGDELRRAAPFPASRIDRIGAGDAFTAGYIHALLLGREERALDYGLCMAALKHSIPGDTMLTTPAEIETLLQREVRDIRR